MLSLINKNSRSINKYMSVLRLSSISFFKFFILYIVRPYSVRTKDMHRRRRLDPQWPGHVSPGVVRGWLTNSLPPRHRIDTAIHYLADVTSALTRIQINHSFVGRGALAPEPEVWPKVLSVLIIIYYPHDLYNQLPSWPSGVKGSFFNSLIICPSVCML